MSHWHRGGAIILCVWVLWILWERHWSSIGQTGYQWDVSGAYENRQECEKVLPEKLRKAMAELQEIAKAIGGKVERRDDVVYFNNPTFSDSTTYKCLPDTVDPSTPKK